MNPKYFHEFLGWRIGPPIGEVKGRGVERSMRPVEVKNFSFRMLDHKTELDKEVR